MTSQNESWKVGLFVVGLLIAGVAGLVALGARGLSRDTVELIAFFDESIEGLSIGTPVKFRGVTVGQVGEIAFAPDRRHVQVSINAYTDVISGFGLEEDASITSASRQLEDDGIRLRIVRSALTGFTYLEADVFDGAVRAVQELPFPKPFNYVPTEPSTLKSLEADLSSSLAEMPKLMRAALRVVNEISATLDELNVAETSARFNAVLARAETKLGELDLASIDALVTELREIATAVDREALARATGGMDELMSSAGRLVERLEGETEKLGPAIAATQGAADALTGELAAAELGATATSLREAAAALELLALTGARTGERAGPALRELERALGAITTLAQRLEREPSSVIFGSQIDEK